MKDLRTLAQKIKIVPGSVEEALRGGGDSVRENALVGNMVFAEEVPFQKQNKVTYQVVNLSTYGGNIKPQGTHLAKHFLER